MEEGEFVLYQKIKEIAKEKGIAISELERKCKFSQGSVCKWNEVNPSFNRVVSVAECLEVPISELANTTKIRKDDANE